MCLSTQARCHYFPLSLLSLLVLYFAHLLALSNACFIEFAAVLVWVAPGPWPVLHLQVEILKLRLNSIMCFLESVLMHLIITQQPAFRPWEDKEESAVQGNDKEKGRVGRRGNKERKASEWKRIGCGFQFWKKIWYSLWRLPTNTTKRLCKK